MDRRKFLKIFGAGVGAGIITGEILIDRMNNAEKKDSDIDSIPLEKDKEKIKKVKHKDSVEQKSDIEKREYSRDEMLDMVKADEVFFQESSHLNTDEIEVKTYQGTHDRKEQFSHIKKYNNEIKDIDSILKKEYERIYSKQKHKVEKALFGDCGYACKKDYLKYYLEHEEQIMHIVFEKIKKFEEKTGVRIPIKIILGILMKEDPRSFKCVRFDNSSIEAQNIDNLEKPAGPFQLSKHTAEHFGLIVSKERDERFNFQKALYAAMSKLQEGYERFGNQWGLSMVNYCSSMRTLIARIEKSFGKNIFSITEQGKIGTKEIFQQKGINIVTYFSGRKFAGWGRKASVQYPFQAMYLVEQVLLKDMQKYREDE